MRISDWSSDVCSSDLSPIGTLTMPRASMLLKLPYSNCASASKRESLGFAVTTFTTPEVAFRPNRVPLGPRRTRSEEHTSELQSLMRISYAVFCLKIKTVIVNCAEDQSTHHTLQSVYTGLYRHDTNIHTR